MFYHHQGGKVLFCVLCAFVVQLKVRWVVEEGYYLEEPPSNITFSPPSGVKVTPERLETKGRIMGEFEQTTEVSAAKPGTYEIPASGEVYYCSIRESWCLLVKRSWKVKVETGAVEKKPAVLEIQVPE